MQKNLFSNIFEKREKNFFFFYKEKIEKKKIFRVKFP